MSTRDAILHRLRDEPSHVEKLVGLLLEELLERPMSELVEPTWLAHAVAEGLHEAARSDDLERWVGQRVEEALSHTDRLEGPVGEYVPVTILGPLEEAVGREYTPDPELVRVLIDHPSLHDLMGAVLQAELLAFGSKLRDVAGDAGKLAGSVFSGRLGSMAKGVASAVGSAAQKGLEDQVKSFVKGAIGRVVDTSIARLCDAEHAEDMAQWRIDMVRAVMEQPLERIVAERHKYPPELFAKDLTAMLRALAGWRQLTDRLEEVLAQAFEEFGDRTARDWLEGSGLEPIVRPHVETLMQRQLQAFVETDAFASWLGELVDG